MKLKTLSGSLQVLLMQTDWDVFTTRWSAFKCAALFDVLMSLQLKQDMLSGSAPFKVANSV